MAEGISRIGKQHTGLIVIFCLALILRVIYLLLYSDLAVWDQLTVDNNYHHHWAVSISQGNVPGDTTYFRAPFYVFCLAGLYSLLGTSLWVARIFGLVIGLASILMTYLIAVRVFDRRVGLLAALIHTLYPICIYFEMELLLDPLFTLLIQLTVHRFLVWWDSRSPRDILLTGLLLGLAAITRPTALIVAPLLIIAIFAFLPRRLAAIRQSAALLLGMLLLIAPITIRNIVVAGDPVLIASQGGINLYIGNNDAADGVSANLPEPMGHNWRISQITHIAESDEGRRLRPGEVSSYWTGRAVDWILHNPGSFLYSYARKIHHQFADREISNNRQISIFAERIPILRYNPLSFGILFALAATGLIFCYGRQKRAAFLTSVILSYCVVSALFFFSSRFRLPLMPLYFVLAAATLSWLTSRFFQGIRQALRAVAVAILFGLISYFPLEPLSSGFASQFKISEGLHWFAHAEYGRALEAFREAREIEPDFPETNLVLGSTFLRLGQMDSAAYYLEREKSLHPGRTKASTNLASIHLLRGRPDSALAEISNALQAAPYDPINNMIYLRAILSDTAITEAQLAAAVNEVSERTNDDIFVLNDAGIQLAGHDRVDMARDILIRAAASTPPPIETDDYAFEGIFRNSRENLTSARAISFYQLGFLAGRQGRFADAIGYSHRAIAADSNLVEAYVNLVSGYLSSGEREAAREILLLADSKFPDNEYVARLKQTLRQ